MRTCISSIRAHDQTFSFFLYSICNHGSWKCDIRPNCFLNNLPIRSDHLSCLVSQNGKSHVLPCPRGFMCRFPPSEDIHDSFRVGICKPKKGKVLASQFFAKNEIRVTYRGTVFSHLNFRSLDGGLYVRVTALFIRLNCTVYNYRVNQHFYGIR